MLDYMFLKVIWWMIVGLMLIVYASTAGYDSGVTMIMPFLRSETDKRVLLNTSAPTWDGNQTWIVFAGGALFVIWPVLYATAFSGLYAVMLCVLWSLFMRPPGYDYRSKIDKAGWRKFWDFGLFISAVVPTFMFGVGFGNCFLGFPFHFDPVTYRDFYTGNIFDLLTPFGILAGVCSLLMVLMHGAAYGARRTEDHIRQTCRKVHVWAAVLLLIGFSITGLMVIFTIKGYVLVSQAKVPTLYPLENVVTQHVGAWIDSYKMYPWKGFFPILAYFGIGATLWANHLKWFKWCFWSSVFAIAGVIGTAGASLFPFIMPSSTNPNQSITVWNATSSQYALNIMLYVGVVLLLLILGYKIFTFHTVWGDKSTLTAEDLEKDSHTYY
ncbi:MAG: cytochrome d ubiquinol oxidase subunit II [Coxiellaceae bacterium]|nr:cytochrome d ubiquinol oxidase subunit II [Coxiellaceae bacterium]